MSKSSPLFTNNVFDDARWACALSLSLMLMVFMPSDESFWVDEGYMAQIISHSRLSDMVSALTSHFGSEPQMPLAAFFYWSWGSFFGHSELALRLANLVPIGFGIVTLALACRPQRLIWPFLLVAASPMTWFYVNEVRPYSLQIGGAAGAAAALLVAVANERLSTKWTIVMCASCLIVAASSLLGLFCLIGVAVVLGFQLLRGRLHLERANWIVALPAFLLFVLITIYYVWTLTSGSGSARDRGVTLSGLGYLLYEILGFGGLGPGRLEIRELSSVGISEMAEIFRPYIFQLLILVVVWLLTSILVFVTALSLIKKRSQTIQTCLLMLAPALIGMGSIIAAALVLKFPLWGRHVVWILPFGFTAIAILLESSELPVLKRFRSIILTILFIMLTISSYQQRYLYRHKKEDYRKAAGMALTAAAHGKNVWWVAASSAGVYYGLDFQDNRIVLHNPDNPLAHPDPDVIIVSRPEFTDSTKVVANIIRETPLTLTHEFTGFKVYEKKEVIAK